MSSQDDPRERALHASWETNAAAWTALIRAGGVRSRVLVTDRAILEAVDAGPLGPILDLGCGEGWLTRALIERGRACVGVDGSAELIAAARALDPSPGRYHLGRYAALVDLPALTGEHRRFASVVANFALLDEDLDGTLAAIAAVLAPAGALLIQTLHPCAVEPPYRDGWRREDFRGLSREGSTEAWAPMPWYFRTFASWVAALDAAGFVLARVDEPLDPTTERPLSLLLRATLKPDRRPRGG